MRLSDFADLISHMPVSKQAFTSKRSTWSAHLQRRDVAGTALKSILDAYCKDSEDIFLSRGDLRDLAVRTDLAEFVIATIIWGYPRGMRGNNLSNLISRLKTLCGLLAHARSNPISDWSSHYERVRPIQGVGLSTYTKLLYFLSANVEGHEALILDQRIVEVAQQNLFEELTSIRGLTSANAAKRYPEYLKCMNDVASQLSLPPDKVEFFLFEFGLHLKSAREPSGVELATNSEAAFERPY